MPGGSGEGRAAYGVWRGVGASGAVRAEGGALGAGTNAADAEMAAIDQCVQQASGRGGEAPRLLVLSDCESVLTSIERAWRGVSAWRLTRQHRQSMLERVLLKRAEWQRQGGSIVFVWTPGHRGLYFNHRGPLVAPPSRSAIGEYERPALTRRGVGPT